MALRALYERVRIAKRVHGAYIIPIETRVRRFRGDQQRGTGAGEDKAQQHLHGHASYGIPGYVVRDAALHLLTVWRLMWGRRRPGRRLGRVVLRMITKNPR